MQGVDGVDDIVISVQPEGLPILVRVGSENCFYLCLWIDFQESGLHRLNLYFAYVSACRHRLTVDIAGRDAVSVDDRQMRDAGTDQSFRTPAADAARAEKDDLRFREKVHRIFTDEETDPVENPGIRITAHFFSNLLNSFGRGDSQRMVSPVWGWRKTIVEAWRASRPIGSNSAPYL